MTNHTCETCGHPVRIASSDEGTHHYEPVCDVARLTAERDEAQANVREAVQDYQSLGQERYEQIQTLTAALAAKDEALQGLLEGYGTYRVCPWCNDIDGHDREICAVAKALDALALTPAGRVAEAQRAVITKARQCRDQELTKDGEAVDLFLELCEALDDLDAAEREAQQ